jgi:hypothetical protein
MNYYVYYTPGKTEELRVWERTVRAAGHTPRILTPRTALNTKLAKQHVGHDDIVALHAAGGGRLCSLDQPETWAKPVKITKAEIEKQLNASLR